MNREPFQQPQENKSLIALFSDLWRETSTLVHKEAELAKAELSEKVSQATTGIAELAIGGLVVFAGFIILLIALSNGLGHFLPEEQADWLAPLIVGAVVMIFGFIALMRGKNNVKPESLTPQRTIESVRRDAQLAKEHVS
ncbi:MAG TPA: phage holin family protein [Burkholderiales bacterium]|nr:phage holin family protein [Burkholderiales bacterium]